MNMANRSKVVANKNIGSRRYKATALTEVGGAHNREKWGVKDCFGNGLKACIELILTEGNIM